MTATIAAPAKPAISTFERYLSVWVALCIVVGIALGYALPGPFRAIASAEVARVNLVVAVLIWLMIIPMLLKIDLGALGSVRQHWKGVGVTLFINWAVKPFSMALLGAVFLGWLFRPLLPAADVSSYIAGLILLAAAPCTAMVFVWSKRVCRVSIALPGERRLSLQADCLMSRLRILADPDFMPALDCDVVRPDFATGLGSLEHRPRVLLLYGSLRERSFSRLAVEEAARLLIVFGCDVRIFDPSDLPLPDQVKADDHPAVHELREHALWSEGQVWCSPERHGQINGIMKAQIDHLPLEFGGMRPTQGRTLAVMQVSGGSQSFNAVNTLRLLGRWMRMFTIPNQSSVPMAFKEFDEAGRMRPSSYYDRIVDVMEELVRFTVLTRGHADQLVDRYSERKSDAAKKDAADDLASRSIA